MTHFSVLSCGCFPAYLVFRACVWVEEEKADWSGLTVEVEDLDAKSGETVYVGKVGDTVKLSPNKEFVFRAKDSKLHRLPPGPRLDHRSAFSNRFPLPEDGYRPRGK